MKIQNQNDISFKQRYVINYKTDLQGSSSTEVLKGYLKFFGESNIYSQSDDLTNKIIVTTGSDTSKLIYDMSSICNKDIMVRNFRTKMSILMEKHFDGAVEFGEKQAQAIKDSIKNILKI